MPEIQQPQSLPVAADPLRTWLLEGRWPPEYFEPDPATPASSEHDSWLEEMMAMPPIPTVQYMEKNGYTYPIPITRTPTLLRQGQSEASLSGSSNGSESVVKSTAYRYVHYYTLLEAKWSFSYDFDHIPQLVLDTCHRLLTTTQTLPQDPVFSDDYFSKLNSELENCNKAMIIQHVTHLLVPSAIHLAMHGDAHLKILTESANKVWSDSIIMEGPAPRPDYAVGFDRSAFTTEQLHKLTPLVDSFSTTTTAASSFSFFRATSTMYFPFLTCQVKPSTSSLDTADRQNAHSMTIAVRGIVELYKAVKRERELDRLPLAFSIAHDNRWVRLYAHYAVIDVGEEVAYYRHCIHTYCFADQEGKARWTAYAFTKNVYDLWMPVHLKRIASAINDLPSDLVLRPS